MKNIFFLIFWIILCKPLFSQNTIGLPRIINYSNSDFHAGTQTWDIKQDKNGIMYFGNSDGLLTFDGNHWSLFPLPNKTIIRSLYIDDNNRIYVGGQDEFGYFSPGNNGTLHYHSLKSLIPKPQSEFADIWDIEPFEGSLFFRATDRIFEFKNNSIRTYPSNSEWRFIKNVESRLIVQDKAKGLLEYKNNSWQSLCKKPFDDFLVTGIIPIGRDSLLISTLKNGLFILINGIASIKKTDAGPDFVKNHIYTLAKISRNEYVVGTTSDGCLIMNLEGRIVQKISRPEGLRNSNVLCLFLDNRSNVWAGLNNGISFIAYNSAIKYIQPNKSNELSGYSTIIFENNLFIATSDGTYMTPLSFQNKDLSFSKGDFTQIKNSNGQVWRLDEVNKKLLMGYNDGAFVIKGKEALPITQGTGAWVFVPLSVPSSKTILTGTYNGIETLKFSENKFIDAGKITGINESLRLLEIDNNNDIWASHPYRGIFKIKLALDEKKCTSELLTAKDGLPSSLGNYVFKIKTRIVFATEKGIYEYDTSSKKFIPSGLLARVFGKREIRYLHEDTEGNIWFCTEKQVGVASFNKNTTGEPFIITYFPELTGEILTGSENIYPFNKENIFIGSEKGVIHLNYEKYVSNKSKLSILLTHVKAIGDETDSTLFGGYFREATSTSTIQNKKNIIRLNNDFNSFHFEYSSPNYGLQKNIEYSYQLVGYDNKWSEWSPKTEKDYTNLPTGNYTFYVKAHDNLGHESDAATYSFYVQPAWYNTVWAYILYIILFILLLYFLDRWQKKNLYLQQVKFDDEQKRLKELHQLKLEKTEKEIIKLQNEKLANEVKFKNKELVDASMHLVERSDALVKVKDELQKLYKKTGDNHDVKKTLQLLKDVEKNNSNWEQFVSHFNEVNNDSLKKLKVQFPVLSNTDLKVCAYLQLNLSSKEIAQLMNISVRGVEISRYRLRKKLQIPTEQTLNNFLNEVGNS